jgi:hypothetical protein
MRRRSGANTEPVVVVEEEEAETSVIVAMYDPQV